MLPQYPATLTKRDCNIINTTIAPSFPDVVYADQGLQPSWTGSLGSTNTYVDTRRAVDVEGRQCAPLHSTIPPGIAQGRRLLYPRITTRIPDYEKMRSMSPDEWVGELRNPSLVLAVPEQFAMPLPSHSKQVERENISAIVDQNWEYRQGEVQLVITKQDTAVQGRLVSVHVYRILSCAHLGCPIRM